MKLFIIFSAVVLGSSGLCCVVRGQKMDALAAEVAGTFVAVSANGALTLTLQPQPDQTVRGTLVGYDGTTYQVEAAMSADGDGPVVDGTISSPQGRGEFTFYPGGDGDYYLSITPYDASGTARPDQAVEFPAQRSAAEDAAAPSAPADAVARDPRLVGTWSTQVIMNTPGGGMATQLFMELRADGTLLDLGSRSMGSFPGAGLDAGLGGGGETAVWRTDGTSLLISYAGSLWVRLAHFEIAGDRLLLSYYDGDRKLWYRQ